MEVFVVDVPVIGRVLYGLTAWQSYQAVKDGRIEVIPMGKKRIMAPIFPNCRRMAGADEAAFSAMVTAVRREHMASPGKKKRESKPRFYRVLPAVLPAP